MTAETSRWTSFQRLVLGSGSSLCMQVLSQIVVRRLQLFDNIRGSTSSSLKGHVAMSLIHVVDVVLVLHGLPVVLILEDFC